MTAPTPAEAGRALSALRPRVTSLCEVCEQPFAHTVRSDLVARTCGRRCRDKLRNRQRPRKSPRAAE